MLMNRRLLVILTIGALIGSLVLGLYPVGSRILRLGLLVAVGGAWLGLLILAWKKKPVRIALLALPLLIGVPFLLPARPLDQNELRRDYLQRMAGFEGTRYHWGGENSLGIDCSGLPRRALRESLLSYGIRNADGGALRMVLEQWWFDASARALSEGYRDYTVPLATFGTIEKMDYAGLAPGDLAVTTDKRHVLAYAGDDRWIQADPGIGFVATRHGRTAKNPWFQREVTLHRWSIFDR
jgi:hypothetical protein